MHRTKFNYSQLSSYNASKTTKQHIQKNQPQPHDVNSSHSVKVLSDMAEGEATVSGYFSKSDGDSLLSGSVHYSTDLSEDSKAISHFRGGGSSHS